MRKRIPCHASSPLYGKSSVALSNRMDFGHDDRVHVAQETFLCNILVCLDDSLARSLLQALQCACQSPLQEVSDVVSAPMMIAIVFPNTPCRYQVSADVGSLYHSLSDFDTSFPEGAPHTRLPRAQVDPDGHDLASTSHPLFLPVLLEWWSMSRRLSNLWSREKGCQFASERGLPLLAEEPQRFCISGLLRRSRAPRRDLHRRTMGLT